MSQVPLSSLSFFFVSSYARVGISVNSAQYSLFLFFSLSCFFSPTRGEGLSVLPHFFFPSLSFLEVLLARGKEEGRGGEGRLGRVTPHLAFKPFGHLVSLLMVRVEGLAFIFPLSLFLFFLFFMNR